MLSRAAQALGQSNDPRAFDALIAAFDDAHWGVRREIPAALARLDGARAVEHLIGMLKDDDAQVRQKAVIALGLGDGAPEAVSALAKARADEHWLVRSTATEALDGLLGKLSVDELIQALTETSDDPNMRWKVARAFSESGAQAVPALAQSLGAENWEVRLGVTLALGHIGGPEVVGTLIQALTDEHWEVRREAAANLGVLGCISQDAIDALMEAAENDDDWAVRDAARGTLHLITSGVSEH